MDEAEEGEEPASEQPLDGPCLRSVPQHAVDEAEEGEEPASEQPLDGPFGLLPRRAGLARLWARRTWRAGGARWVGGAMAACPDDVPWQRVINSKGEISERTGARARGLLLPAPERLLEAPGKAPT